jgi:hypothetical protein
LLIRNDIGGINIEKLIPLIFDGMNTHKHSVESNRVCLNLLRLLAIDTSATQALIIKDFQVSDLIDTTMRRFLKDPIIQIEAFGLLGNVCTSSDIQAILSHSRVMDTLIECQVTHKGNPRVQQAVLFFQHQILEYSSGTTAADFAFGGSFDQSRLLSSLLL